MIDFINSYYSDTITLENNFYILIIPYFIEKCAQILVYFQCKIEIYYLCKLTSLANQIHF